MFKDKTHVISLPSNLITIVSLETKCSSTHFFHSHSLTNSEKIYVQWFRFSYTSNNNYTIDFCENLHVAREHNQNLNQIPCVEETASSSLIFIKNKVFMIFFKFILQNPSSVASKNIIIYHNDGPWNKTTETSYKFTHSIFNGPVVQCNYIRQRQRFLHIFLARTLSFKMWKLVK